MKNFLKKYWPDTLFMLIAVCLCGLFFVPMISIVTKNSEGIKNYLNFSFFDVVFGGTNGSIKLNMNYLYLVVFALLLISFVFDLIAFIKAFKSKEVKNYLYYVSAVIKIIDLFAFALVSTLLPLTSKEINNIQDFNKVDYVGWLYALFTFLYAFLVLITLSKIFEKKKFTIYEISEIAIFCALALVLDKVKIPVGITGGSINASALPLMIIALRHGFLKGLISSSVVFGLISCLLDGYGFQTYPFDYLIAFSGYATVGLYMYLFKKYVIKDRENIEFASIVVSIVLGGLSSFITRMLGSSLSSMIFYSYSLKDALIYNLSYIPLSVFGSTLIALLLARPLQIINHRFPVHVK